MTDNATNPTYYTSPVLPAFTKPGDGSPRYLTTNDIEDYVNASFEEFVDSSPVTRDLDFSGVDIPGYSPTPTDLPVVADVDLAVNSTEETNAVEAFEDSFTGETEPEVYIHETEYVDEHPEFPDLSGLPETVTVRTDVLIGLLLSYIQDNLFDPPQLHGEDITIPSLTDVVDDSTEDIVEHDESEASITAGADRDLDFDGVDIPGATETTDEPTVAAEADQAPSPTATTADSSAHETWGTDNGEVAKAETPSRPNVDTDTPGGSTQTKTASRDQSPSETTSDDDSNVYGHDTESDSLGSLDDIKNKSIYDDLGVEPTHKQSQEIKSSSSRIVAFVFSMLGFGKSVGFGLGRIGLFLTQKTVLIFEGLAAMLLILYGMNAVIWLLFPAAALPVDVTTYAGRLAVFGDLTFRVMVTTVGLLLIGVVIDWVTRNNRYDTPEAPNRL